MTNTEFSAQKSLASQLDVCAMRAESIDAPSATSKQCWYLAGLIIQSGESGDEFYTNTSLVLTKRKASHLIDVYKN